MDKKVRNIVIYAIGSFLLVDVPVFIQLLTGLKTEPINFPDLIDLIIYAPFMMIILFELYRSYEVRDGRIKYGFMLAYGAFFEGHGIHWAANAVDLLQHCSDSSCLARYGEAAESQKLAYFLDEILGHKLMFYPLLIILLIFLLLDTEANLNKNEKIALYIAGVLHGFYLIVATVEGQTGLEGLIFATISILLILYKFGFEGMKKRPFATFIFITSITMLVLGISWWAYWGALIEPSKVLHF